MAGDYTYYHIPNSTSWRLESICPKCNKPYIYVGDPIVGIGPKPWCECDKPIATPKQYAEGWVCPKCGRVSAPWVSTCPCWQLNATVTAGTMAQFEGQFSWTGTQDCAKE